jgi:hypothetical protein
MYTKETATEIYAERTVYVLHVRSQGMLLSFGAESLVLHYVIQKVKDEDKKDSNFACCFVWV